MSIPFTPISDGLDWQGMPFLLELQTAWNERRYAIGQSPVGWGSPWVAPGTDIQAVTQWWNDTISLGEDFPNQYNVVQEGPQSWMEWFCVQFLDHRHSLDPMPPAFTLATWRVAAGLHAYGFRRAQSWPLDWTDQNDPAYQHGHMQAGDIIGPWVFDDIQRGLSALRWARASILFGDAYYGLQWNGELSTTFPNRSSLNISVTESTWAQRRAAWNTAYSTGAWAGGGWQYLWLEEITAFGSWYGTITDGGRVRMSLPGAPCPFTPVLYATLGAGIIARPYVDFRHLDPPLGGSCIYLHEGAQVPAGGSWSHPSVRTTLPGGAWDLSLIDAYPFHDPTEPEGVQAISPELLIKWDFTNSG